MPHSSDLILTLTGGLVAALALGFLTQKLRLSPIVGYLLAGIILGPHTPGLAVDAGIAGQFAELGVILLMFGVGLHFHLSDLLAVWKVAVPGAVTEITVVTALGACLTHLMGWTWTQGIVFGMAVSVASTVVLTRVLAANRALHTPVGHTAIGWLIVEDLFTIMVLVALPALFGAQATGADRDVWTLLGVAGLKIVVLVAFTLVAGQKIIPWFLGFVARTRSRELFTLTILALALGIAVGSAKFFGASMALGAFLAGMVVGQSEFSARAASEALPMRDAFAVLFFVSVGMMFDPMAFAEHGTLMFVTLGIVVLGKPLAAGSVALLLGKPVRAAVSIAVALAQIGEFSFILAQLAGQLKILPSSAVNALVFTSLVAITLNPLMFKLVDPFVDWLEKKGWAKKPASEPGIEAPLLEDETVARAVVIGYGPVGKTLCRILRDNAIEPVVVEMNLDTVRAMRAEGLPVVYGEASSREILHHAGIEQAMGLMITASSGVTKEVVQAARELNPKIRILARANYLKESSALTGAGADAVFSGEGEIALSMTAFLMEELGATSEQVENERDRVREELF